MKHLIVFIPALFLLESNCIAQIQFSYYYDSLSIEDEYSITRYTFIPFEKKINEGLSKGTYWVKANNQKEKKIVEIPSALILQVTGYEDGIKIQRINDNRFFTFQINSNKEVLLKIACTKQAYIPLDQFDATKYASQNLNQYLIFGLYYGFAIMVLTMNMFYYFTFRENTFLLYSVTLLSIMLTFFFSDGLFSWFLLPNWLIEYGDVITHSAVAIIGAIFSSTYLQHEIYFPKLKYWVSAQGLIMVFSYFLYTLNKEIIFFAIGEMLAMAILATFWVSAVVINKKSTFSRIYAVAYGFLLFMTFDFYLAPLHGLPSIGMGTNMLKIGGIMEMLVLSYAVMYRMQALKKEHDEMKNALYLYASEIEHLEENLQSLKEGRKNALTKYVLNPREVEVISLISKGLTNKEIADRLFISVNTVKYHTKNLYTKLDIGSRQEASKKAVEISIDLN